MFTMHSLTDSFYRFLARQETIFYQFGALNAIRLLGAELTRKTLDPYNISSYSQTGEDRIIDCILLGRKTGFYVEVGCNHPQAYSNTYTFYKRGWSGITIDANENLIQKHHRLRKQDKSICAVISDKEQEVVFTEFEESLVSSLDANHVSEYSKNLNIKGKRLVNTVSLDTLLQEYEIPRDFDLLSIDVEGHDFEVLCSLNLHTYRPKMIVIEMHGFDLINPKSSQIYEYLRANDYKMVGYVIMNGYFVDSLIQAS
jgi:FkbM family methyltransferase